MQADAKFWDRIAEKYARTPIKDVASYEQSLERTRSWLSETDRVLELGCGSGSTALLLAPNVAHLTACDISPEMIRIGRRKAEAEGTSNIDFRATDFPDGIDKGGPLDTVMAFNLLHLVRDIDATLGKVRKVLKPGGLFISKTPCIGRSRLLKILLPLMQVIGKAPGTVSFLTVPELEERISGAGFEIVEVGSYPDAKIPNRYVVARKL